ncbi:MAG: non-ribosomal peptide synthetase, partial [Candidatus Electrothrix sp. MAN1_4]|nr:non-ribosomal peptide synthetase [Candidatus Electrothrix sp. MAN1_4]
MSIVELISQAEEKGVQLWVEGERLRFKAPEGSLHPELKAELSGNKFEIIAFLKKQQDISEAINQDRFSLSYGQQALWFIYQEAPGNPAYNMVSALHISENVDAIALQNTLQTVAERHAQLRTHFEVDSEGEVWQQVTDTLPKLEIIDAGRWTWEEVSEQARHYSQQPFDLTQNGFRAALFHKKNNSYLLVFVLHHILGDARSMGIIQQEWMSLYHHETEGKTSDLAHLTKSYAHYVQQEVKLLNSPQGKQSADYWHQQLAGEVPILNLPADHPRPKTQTFNGASCQFQLSSKLSAQLTAFAQKQKTSLFTLLLGAFQILLHRYTGQTDIRVGTPTSAGRLNADFSRSVGYFVNPVVLRGRFSDDNIHFHDFITQLHSQVISALAHQSYPFPLLVQRLQPQRDASISPLFQVMFSWHNQDEELEKASEGSAYTPVDLPQMESQFDITLTIAEAKEFTCVLNYKADLFDAERIQRMAKHFTILLEGIVQQPEADIRTLPLLTETEKHQLVAWNDTATEYPKDKTVVDLCEEQV